MKTEELQAKGLTEEQIAFVMAENGKDIKKLQKENETLTADRDSLKERAETAEETLKKFEGIDPEAIQEEITKWKQKAETAEKDYAEKLAQRDFEDALKEEIGNYKFTSEAAKKAIMAEIRESGLKCKDGKILGLGDLIDQIKQKDASAFVDEQQETFEQNKARFTQPLNAGRAQSSREKFAAMSLDERMKLKASDPAAYEKMKNS